MKAFAMKSIFHCVLYFQIISLIFARSIRETDYNEEIDLARSGRLLAEWNENLDVNPEELGSYIEGDIVFPQGIGRSGLSAATSRWPKGIVPYEIKGNFDAFEMGTIEKAFNMYHNNTCIHWVPRKNQKDFVRITSESSGCWSTVGKVGGSQQINLQRPACLKRLGTVVHEMMHSLGFFHEQTRPDRDEFVTIAFNNIRYGHEHNFDKNQRSKVNDFGVGYDYGSVMHYSSKAFSKNGKPTIIPKKNDAEIGQRKGFSEEDIKKVNRMYKCEK